MQRKLNGQGDGFGNLCLIMFGPIIKDYSVFRAVLVVSLLLGSCMFVSIVFFTFW